MTQTIVLLWENHYGLEKLQIFALNSKPISILFPALNSAVKVFKNLVSYLIIRFYTMCNYARHANNDNKAIYTSCTAGVDLYTGLRLGNTFAFLEPVQRLFFCHLHVGSQV